MVEIRSLEPFCPVLATCEPGGVDAVLASLGRSRDAVVIVAKPHETPEEMLVRERQEHAADVRDLRADVRRKGDEIEAAHKETREARRKQDTAAHEAREARAKLQAATDELLSFKLLSFKRLVEPQLSLGGGI